MRALEGAESAQKDGEEGGAGRKRRVIQRLLLDYKIDLVFRKGSFASTFLTQIMSRWILAIVMFESSQLGNSPVALVGWKFRPFYASFFFLYLRLKNKMKTEIPFKSKSGLLDGT